MHVKSKNSLGQKPPGSRRACLATAGGSVVGISLLEFFMNPLRRLVRTYYQKRGWTETGIPTVDTLKRVGLWNFLREEVRMKIGDLLAAS